MRSSPQDLPQPKAPPVVASRSPAPPTISTQLANSDSTDQGGSQVLRDLKTMGPDCPALPQFSLVQAQKYCLDLAVSHQENFTVASYLFPSRYRQHLANIYAYSRWADDLADETANATLASGLLDWWEKEFRSSWTKQAQHPVLIALKQTMTECSLSPQPFLDLLSAFRQDQFQFRYSDDDQLASYCNRSANPVGRIVLALAGCQSDRQRQLSDSICTGLQIANFCQDISEDALRGRIYMPASRWEHLGISQSDFTQGSSHPELKGALANWVHSAEHHLHQGIPLVRIVPRWLARNLQMFIRGGLAITTAIAQADYDVWREPVQVSKHQKARILIRSILLPRSTRFPMVAPKSWPPASKSYEASKSRCD